MRCSFFRRSTARKPLASPSRDQVTGLAWVRGVLQFAPAEAVCMQDLVERGEPLSYSGPVWRDGRWTTETFPIELIDVRTAVGEGVLIGFDATQLAGAFLKSSLTRVRM